MSEQKIIDIAHVMFLEMIQTFINTMGPQAAKGSLMRGAVKTGDSFPATAYDTMEDFVAAIETQENPITRIEGKATHLGDGLFGLPQCPFAESIGSFKEVYGALPESYGAITEDYNKSAPVTEKYNVGHGAGVSPFCAIHQPLRSAIGAKVSIGGKQVTLYQLGCKSGTGYKGLAMPFIEATGFSKETVEKVLDDNMCCYAVVLER